MTHSQPPHARITEQRRRTLTDIPLSRVWQAQQRAQLRIQLYAMGATHELLGDLGQTTKDILMERSDAQGKLAGANLLYAKQEIQRAWDKTFQQWKRLTMALRREAASIPFGVMAVYQEKFVNPALKNAGVTESVQPFTEAQPAVTDYVFRPQLQELLDATASHVYGDGLNLSSRIWGLNAWAQSGIDQTLYAGVAQGASAWDIANNMEKFLGFNADCPRWTSTRLYKLDKTAIAAGDTTGLYSGSACGGQGVAFNALRMARTEIQFVHGQATDYAMAKMPWIDEERIYLSRVHPEPDICDDVVNGGRSGKGIYPVGTIVLPLHPHCLCGKEALQPDPALFIQDLRAWMQGGSSPKVSEYAALFGQNQNSFGLMDLAQGFVVGALTDWLFGSPSTLAGRVLAVVT